MALERRRCRGSQNITTAEHEIFVIVETFDAMQAIASHRQLSTVDSSTFEREVLRSPVPVLVDFSTAWCGPCRLLAPLLSDLAARSGGRYRVLVVDGDAEPELCQRLGVRGFPTVVVFARGDEVARQLGLARRERYVQMIEGAFSG